MPHKLRRSMLTLAIAASVRVALVVGVDQVAVPIRVSPGVQDLSCRAEGAGGPELLERNQDGSLLLRCPIASEIQCDGAGVEPVDIDGGLLCRARALTLTPATSVMLAADDAEAIALEWLDLTDFGPPTVLATRSFELPTQKRRSVPVRQHENRALRVTPIGYAPHTLASAHLKSDEPWPVPSLPGGELLLRLPDVPVVPVAVDLVGATTTHTVPVDAPGWISVPGLPEGPYRLRAKYEGLATARAGRTTSSNLPDVQIEDGHSAAVLMPAEPLGALFVTAGPTACTATRIVRVTGPSGQFRLVDKGACEWAIAGLTPGTHVVTLETDAGPYVVDEVVVSPQEATSVVLDDHEAANLSGQVRVNGELAPGFVVELVDERVPMLRSVARADGGIYSLTVGRPGRYSVSVRDARRRVEAMSKTVDLVAGSNRLDWDLEGGTVNVTLVGWDRSADVEARLRADRHAESVTIARDDAVPAAITGLGFGQYSISANEPSQGLTSEQVDFEITPDEPAADVTLALTRTTVTLVLDDEQGSPVNTSSVRGTRVGDGVYELAIRPGTELVIRAPGFAPVCRVVPNGQQLRVTMMRSQPRELHIIGHDGGGDPGIGLLLPGSDCPLALRVFDPVQLAPSESGVPRWLVDVFPGRGRATVFWRGSTQATPFVIPVAGPIVLRRPF